jgi:hypothetical protein
MRGEDLGDKWPTMRVEAATLAVGGPENFPRQRQTISVLDQTNGQWVPCIALSPQEYVRTTDWGKNTIQYKLWKLRAPVKATDADWALATRTPVARAVAAARDQVIAATTTPSSGKGLFQRLFGTSTSGDDLEGDEQEGNL